MHASGGGEREAEWERESSAGTPGISSEAPQVIPMCGQG